MTVTGIILVAGNSTRFRKNSNKNFEKINDKYIFEYSLEQFLENSNITNIIIAAKKEEFEFINNVIHKKNGKPINII